MRTTISRMDRAARAEPASALWAIQSYYDEIAQAVLTAARGRGYLGFDPLGALTHLNAPQSGETRLAVLILELWRVFFAGFREDEATFEAEQLREQVRELCGRVEALPPGEIPDGELAPRMLQALISLWEERQDLLHERLDAVIGESRSQARELDGSRLATAHAEDEMNRMASVIGAALADLGDAAPGEETLASALPRLLCRYRDDLVRSKAQNEAERRRFQAFLDLLKAAASGSVDQDPALGELVGRPAWTAAAEVARLLGENRDLDKALRELQTAYAQADAGRASAEAEVAARDKLLARYELAEAVLEDGDERLALYRRCAAAWEEGKDPKVILEKIRQLERVIVLSTKDDEVVRKMVDDFLDDLVRRLGDLRRLMPLAEDPRRFRGRLLAASPYRLKTLSGLVQATRDAARDLAQYADTARWAAGVVYLGRELPKMRKVFTEMVKLVADCRAKGGGPPPASLRVSMELTAGIASLPAILAADVRALTRSKPLQRFASVLAPLMEECTQALHGMLQRAKGEEIARPQANPRESSQKALERLAEEMAQLAGLMDSAFAEARERGWELSAAERALMDNEQLIAVGLRGVDGACEVLAGLPGAPKASLQRLPPSRGATIDRIRSSLRERIQWLEDVGRYRYEVRPAEG